MSISKSVQTLLEQLYKGHTLDNFSDEELEALIIETRRARRTVLRDVAEKKPAKKASKKSKAEPGKKLLKAATQLTPEEKMQLIAALKGADK